MRYGKLLYLVFSEFSVIAAVKNSLATFVDPFLETDLVSTHVVKDICREQDRIVIHLQFGYPISSWRKDEITQRLLLHLQHSFPQEKFKVQIEWKVKSHAIQTGVKNLANVKNIIAVASGKGGVGKSTTAVNLALALQNQGAAVGLLDADIYGPNQPQMLGIKNADNVQSNNKLLPITVYGLQTMSIGYLVDTKTPMIWRGPMVTSALLQLLNETAWENLDYLIVDLPPGTGDIQLTLAQKIPVSGAVIVTTPQEVALQDARKGIEMFQKVKIPILGVVENMSTFVCSHCHHEESIFGINGGSQLAQEYQVAFLGEIPLVKTIREYADQGTPIVYTQPNSEVSAKYVEIAMRMASVLSLQEKSYAHHFPKITIENTEV